MEYLNTIGVILIVNLLGWITPGPNMLAVMSASLSHGRAQGLKLALGLSIGATLWAGLAVAGAATMFDLFPRAMLMLKLVGAGYLIWLGCKSLAAAARRQEVVVAAEPAPGRGLRQGLIVSLTNPKAALFWGSVMTTAVPAGAPGWFLVLIVAFCGALAICLHSITATVFSTGQAMRVFSRAKRAITACFGMVFIALGGAVSWSVLRRS